MSEQNADVDATETEGTEQESEQQQEQQKPTETVEFWKTKAREQEKRAKDNAAAAKRLGELEDAQKTDAEKAADRIKKAEDEAASVPSKVSDALRTHLVALHGIESEDADLFLTANDPELLLKQVDRLVGQSGKRKKSNFVPREGTSSTAGESDERSFARDFFGGN